MLLDVDGAVYLLDLAVANRFPRVKELAVLAANLTHGCPDPLPTRTETIAELYSTAAPAPLSAAERAALRVFARAVIAAVHGQLRRRPERQRRPGPEEAEEAAGRLPGTASGTGSAQFSAVTVAVYRLAQPHPGLPVPGRDARARRARRPVIGH